MKIRSVGAELFHAEKHHYSNTRLFQRLKPVLWELQIEYSLCNGDLCSLQNCSIEVVIVTDVT